MKLAYFKRLWKNRAIKTAVVTAAGGAFGAIQPMIASGTLEISAATLHMAAAGAMAALAGLYIRKPEKEKP